MLASSSRDNTPNTRDGNIILWDVKTGQPIGQPLVRHIEPMDEYLDWILSINFSPNEKILASGGGDGKVILWDIDPQSWVEKTCRRINRSFTSTEWARYFPDDAYRATCPQ